MTFAALKDLDSDTLEAVVLRAAEFELPSDGIEDDTSNTTIGERATALLQELRNRIGNNSDQESPKVRAAVSDALTALLFGALTTPEREAAAERRLGAAGRLSPSAYKVDFTPTFFAEFGSVGVRRGQVERTVQEPDRYEHILNDESETDDKDSFSLFLRRSRPRDNLQQRWLLVQCLRVDKSQVVQAAWWIDDLEGNGDKPLIKILAEFAEQFGVNVTVGGVTGKFLSDIKVEIGNGGSADAMVHFDAASKNVFRTFSFRHVPSKRIAFIGIVYGIEKDRYKKAVFSH